MLRSAIVFIGAACVVGGVLAILWTRTFPGAVFVFWGAVLLLGTLYERVRYKVLLREQPRDAVRTNERFVDDETGKTVTVYIDPTTGERSYVEE
jgi:membrane protein implicated in regulation of membrane protease activity